MSCCAGCVHFRGHRSLGAAVNEEGEIQVWKTATDAELEAASPSCEGLKAPGPSPSCSGRIERPRPRRRDAFQLERADK